MREPRLEELLRDARAHPARLLDDATLQAARATVLARFAAQRRATRLPLLTRLLESAALPLAAAGVILAAADWLGGLWRTTAAAVSGATELSSRGSESLDALLEAMAAQPWLVVTLAAGAALLWLPPVRAALSGARE